MNGCGRKQNIAYVYNMGYVLFLLAVIHIEKRFNIVAKKMFDFNTFLNFDKETYRNGSMEFFFLQFSRTKMEMFYHKVIINATVFSFKHRLS